MNIEGHINIIEQECQFLRERLEEMQAERKTGKWTDDNACPFCGFQPWYERDIYTLSFCPNCGARMMEVGDESQIQTDA